MQTKEVGSKLEAVIKSGDFQGVKDLLKNINDANVIKQLETEFSNLDPVVYAVECKEEKIALYLLEKGFSYTNIYTFPGQKCDQWCLKDHGESRCPADYDARDLAQKNGMLGLANILLDFQKGIRHPGEGLAVLQYPAGHGYHTHRTNKNVKGLNSGNSCPLENDVTASKEQIRKLGPQYRTENGGTLLHEAVYVSATVVNICIAAGVVVNAQNFDGDTALHLAVREGIHYAAEALLMSGADLSLRNKLGQTPLHECSESLKPLFDLYKPGLVHAVTKGEQKATQQLIRLWANPNNPIKNGKSALQLVEAGSKTDSAIRKCYNLLKQNKATLDLVHSVLSADEERLKRIIETEKGWNINSRHKDKKGHVLIQCAIEQHNLQLITQLVDSGKCNLNVRVRENSQSEDTVPLYFKTLDSSCPSEIWKFISFRLDPHQHLEKDSDGNTPILRAIQNGRSVEFIYTLIRSQNGRNLTQRNALGLTPREVAHMLDRQDVVEKIDQYILDHVGENELIHFPLQFYGNENLNIKNKEGRTILDLALQSNCEGDTRVAKRYQKVEDLGVRLFQAAARGDAKEVAKLNNAQYQDKTIGGRDMFEFRLSKEEKDRRYFGLKNGYTALIRAIVFYQYKVAEILITDRPSLKYIPDNSNRYPLHYAYALPHDQGQTFVKMLLEKHAEDLEHRVDKDGQEPADYKDLRDSNEIIRMLHDARTLDSYKQRGSPMAPLPPGVDDLGQQNDAQSAS